MKKFLLLIIIILVSSCSSIQSDNNKFLFTADLPASEQVKESGKKLINQPYGFTKIIADSAQINETLIIAVHGYDSRGYEWITSLNQLAENYNNTYFYRYDWEICPDSLGRNLADSLVTLIQSKANLNKIIIFGHSYGGLVVTYLASNIDLKIPIEIHTIAAPLAGYPRIMDKCDLQYNEYSILAYPSWKTNVSHRQWRTQKQQDGAFRDLDYDPQEIMFDNSKIILLPETMNGKRLGHNWSVTWVINNYLNE
jgi:hypothetical protein